MTCARPTWVPGSAPELSNRLAANGAGDPVERDAPGLRGLGRGGAAAHAFGRSAAR
jgi:hypothetical protein